MDVMWAAEKPLSRGELMERSVDKSWKSSSVHILLNSMLSKGAICEAGFTRCGKTCGRTYAAAVTVEEYFLNLIAAANTKPDSIKFICLFANQAGIMQNKIKAIQKILID